MIARPSLMLLMAGAAGLSAVAHGMTAAAQDASQQAQPKTRLRTAIEQDMSQRDRQAAQRRRSLTLREQAAAAAEARLQASMASQRQAAEAEAATDEPAEAEGAQFDELARIYQSMRPKNAAVVFEQLAMEVQVEVARRMRERNTALIMANMSPEGAARLTMALARGREDSGRRPAATGGAQAGAR